MLKKINDMIFLHTFHLNIKQIIARERNRISFYNNIHNIQNQISNSQNTDPVFENLNKLFSIDISNKDYLKYIEADKSHKTIIKQVRKKSLTNNYQQTTSKQS